MRGLLQVVGCLWVLAATVGCGGMAADGDSPPFDVADVSDPASSVPRSEPAVIVGGFVDPPVEAPVAHDLELSDGTVTYRVMFGNHATGADIAARINSFTDATIVASVDAQGRLVLSTVETGSSAKLLVLRGEALPMLGLSPRTSATGT